MLQGTDAAVRHLWAHQADALRTYYEKHCDSSDVALEFPTGAGKTLVGALIAEWRRRKFRERVAFVCPTNQLANQAARKARGYGIDVVLLVGSHRDWDAEDRAAFNMGNAIAVTNYHHIFNSDPKIDPQTLVLDDAHAGEPAVSGRWTVEASREEALYGALKEVVADSLPPHFAHMIGEELADPRARQRVELIPPTVVARQESEIAGAIDRHVVEGSPASYAWTTVRPGLSACSMYVSWSGITLRPLIAPTATLPQFNDARQRVYMSATLGQAGELERSFGVPAIERIPLPRGWERQGSGRRLPLFPSLSGEADIRETTKSALLAAKHNLVITPSEREAQYAEDNLIPDGMPVLTKENVLVDFDAFTRPEAAALLLANRYDGMDLPDDACRLVLLHGLPVGAHLQERFLFDTLGAREALNERIRTRISQGMGRATRNRQDFAAVLFTGTELVSFISREDVRQSLRAELQAELALGLHYADEGISIGEALTAFFDQGKDWQPVEVHLREQAEELVPHPTPGSEALAEAAPHEVRAWRHAWRGDFSGACNHGLQAINALTGESVKQYRALWRYLVASWAQLVAEATREDHDKRLATEARRDAEVAFATLRWFPRFEGQIESPSVGPEYSWRADRGAEWLESNRRGPRLQREINRLRARIDSDEYREFELGLETLGQILGFDAVRPNRTADPDGAWRDGERAWLLWEAKTMEHDEAGLSARDVRQANSHRNWVAHQLGWAEPERTATVIVCERDTIHPDGAAVANQHVFLVAPALVRQLAQRATEAIVTAANDAPALSPEGLRERIGELFVQHRLGTDEILDELSSKPIVAG